MSLTGVRSCNKFDYFMEFNNKRCYPVRGVMLWRWAANPNNRFFSFATIKSVININIFAIFQQLRPEECTVFGTIACKHATYFNNNYLLFLGV